MSEGRSLRERFASLLCCCATSAGTSDSEEACGCSRVCSKVCGRVRQVRSLQELCEPHLIKWINGYLRGNLTVKNILDVCNNDRFALLFERVAKIEILDGNYFRKSRRQERIQRTLNKYRSFGLLNKDISETYKNLVCDKDVTAVRHCMAVLVGLHLEMEQEERELLEEHQGIMEKMLLERRNKLARDENVMAGRHRDIYGDNLDLTRCTSDGSIQLTVEDMIKIAYKKNKHLLPGTRYR